MTVPAIRIDLCNSAPVNANGDYVLYWMIANRRSASNFSLDRAIEYARELNKPLLVFEALRCGYQWASDRLHKFVIDGMLDNSRVFADQGVTYFPYLEPEAGAGKELLETLAAQACVVVTDEFPSFFLPRMVRMVADRLRVRLEQVDSNGILPLRATDRAFTRAHDFRRFLQKNLREYLAELPDAAPLSNLKLPRLQGIPKEISERWPPADLDAFSDSSCGLADFPIDHAVVPVDYSGGSQAGSDSIRKFCNARLHRYADDRNQPEQEVCSGLSPYLHFGHVSAHQVFTHLTGDEQWQISDLAEKVNGSRSGWWGCSPALEAFLDEVITWREVGYNMCHLTDNFDQYESLPEWAQLTLANHADDVRPATYSLEQFEAAETHNDLWNAAQTQLVREGRIHNYLRMLWGKKILHWSESPQQALKIMIELNNKYAVDGRNPNSYSGIFWVLGRYDRAWGPEREIFGKVRYMTCDNTARKVRVKEYIRQYAPGSADKGLFDDEKN